MSSSEVADLKQFLTQKFTQIDARLDTMDRRFVVIESRLDRLESRVAGLDRKIDGLSVAVAQAIDAANEACAEQHKEHRLRLAYLESKLA